MRNIVTVKEVTFFKVARPGVAYIALHTDIGALQKQGIVGAHPYAKEIRPETGCVVSISQRNAVFSNYLAKCRIYILNERFSSNNLFCCVRI